MKSFSLVRAQIFSSGPGLKSIGVKLSLFAYVDVDLDLDLDVDND